MLQQNLRSFFPFPLSAARRRIRRLGTERPASSCPGLHCIEHGSQRPSGGPSRNVLQVHMSWLGFCRRLPPSATLLPYASRRQDKRRSGGCVAPELCRDGARGRIHPPPSDPRAGSLPAWATPPGPEIGLSRSPSLVRQESAPICLWPRSSAPWRTRGRQSSRRRSEGDGARCPCGRPAANRRNTYACRRADWRRNAASGTVRSAPFLASLGRRMAPPPFLLPPDLLMRPLSRGDAGAAVRPLPTCHRLGGETWRALGELATRWTQAAASYRFPPARPRLAELAGCRPSNADHKACRARAGSARQPMPTRDGSAMLLLWTSRGRRPRPSLISARAVKGGSISPFPSALPPSRARPRLHRWRNNGV